jgi:hypothetical protein
MKRISPASSDIFLNKALAQIILKKNSPLVEAIGLPFHPQTVFSLYPRQAQSRIPRDKKTWDPVLDLPGIPILEF